jgi:hypothetical protein
MAWTNTLARSFGIYGTRASIEKMIQENNIHKDNSKFPGYDTLLPKLRETTQEHICISGFETSIL